MTYITTNNTNLSAFKETSCSMNTEPQFPKMANQKDLNLYLKWGTRDEKAVIGIIKPHCFGKEGILILDPMSFVNDYIAPAKATQRGLLFNCHFKTSYTDIELPSNQ